MVFTCQCVSLFPCRCVAGCCSSLQGVAVCCSVLQCVAVCCSVLQCAAVCCSVLQCGAVCCSVVQCGAVWCSVLQCVSVSRVFNGVIMSTGFSVVMSVCCNVWQCVTASCSTLQRVAAYTISQVYGVVMPICLSVCVSLLTSVCLFLLTSTCLSIIMSVCCNAFSVLQCVVFLVSCPCVSDALKVWENTDFILEREIPSPPHSPPAIALLFLSVSLSRRVLSFASPFLFRFSLFACLSIFLSLALFEHLSLALSPIFFVCVRGGGEGGAEEEVFMQSLQEDSCILMNIFKCVATYCSVRCSAVQCGAVMGGKTFIQAHDEDWCIVKYVDVLQCVAVCCSVLQCIAVCWSDAGGGFSCKQHKRVRIFL